MADSDLNSQALEAYNVFLHSVLQVVKYHRERIFESLSEREQEKVIWYLHKQSENDYYFNENRIVRPPRGSRNDNRIPIPTISEDKYVDYIDKHYKSKIIMNSMRHQEYENELLKSRAVTEIDELVRIELESVFYKIALDDYNAFLHSVLTVVRDYRHSMFKCLSKREQDKVIWYLHNQSKNVKGSILQKFVKPPRDSYNYACIPTSLEDKYVDYIDKHYKSKIIMNSMRHQEYENDDIKIRVVSEIEELERIELNKILGRK